MPIQTLVVDDEPLARRRILSLLKDDRDVEVVGECGDGKAAVDAILKLRPELVLLDVQMPELDGFGVINAIPPDRLPVVVFITAFDQYAVKAFETHALDYLLKPYNKTRFHDAMTRAKEYLHQRELGLYEQKIQAALRQLHPERNRIVLKLRGRIVFVPSGDIHWIEADANCVRLHMQGETHVVREKISTIEQSLDPEMFVRIHRSFIVNVAMIKELQPCNSGEYIVVLRDGRELPSGRTYRTEIERIIKRGAVID